MKSVSFSILEIQVAVSHFAPDRLVLAVSNVLSMTTKQTMRTDAKELLPRLV